MMSIDRKKGFLKFMNKIFERGDYAGRGNEKYTFVTSHYVNCFGHAFFNFRNKYLNKLIRRYPMQLYDFFFYFKGIKYRGDKAYEKITQDMLERIKMTGLEITESDIDEKLEDGEWKVAYYFNFDDREIDFHFLRQEKDGSWSGKFGKSKRVESFEQLPIIYDGRYYLRGIFKIKNPFFEKDKEANLED